MLTANIRVVLAEMAMKEKQYDRAIDHLQDAKDCISVRVKGSHGRYRIEIQQMIDSAIQRKAGN